MTSDNINSDAVWTEFEAMLKVNVMLGQWEITDMERAVNDMRNRVSKELKDKGYS
jgi:hypothetical protein